MRGDQNQSIVAISNLETVIEDGLWRPPYADRMLADLYMKSGEYSNAIPHLIEITNRWPDDIKRQLQLDYAIKRQQRRN
jgi:hypothetical protein